jgi:hypothetical protein
VEVRKILKEARQIAERIETKVPPPPPTVHPAVPRDQEKALQDAKRRLLSDIEEAQLRAGDFTIKRTSESVSFDRWLTLAQVRYGHIQEAVQTAGRGRLGGYLPTLVAILAGSGEIQAAFTVVENELSKEGDAPSRNRERAIAFAALAPEQAKIDAEAARLTLSQAREAADALKQYPSWQYFALVNIARAQSAIGDKPASAENLKRARDIALALRENGHRAGALAVVANAQAETGDQVASDLTFQRVIELMKNLDPKQRASALAWTACQQMANGSHAAGVQTFQQALETAESLAARDRDQALAKIRELQIKAGENQSVADAVRQGLPNTIAIADERSRAEKLQDLARLAAEAGDFELATKTADAIESDTWKVSAMQHITRLSLEAKSRPDGTQVIQRLSQTATAMAQKGISKTNPDMKNVEWAIRHALENIAYIQAAAGNARAAIQTLNNANSTNTYAYKRIVGTLIKIGDLAGAELAVAEMKNASETPLSLLEERRAIARAYAQVGNVKSALAWVQKQREPYAKASALIGVATGILDGKGIENLSKSSTRQELC